MVLPDGIVKSHQLLAQTIVDIFSSFLEDGHDDPSSLFEQPCESVDSITERNETALSEHAANLIKLVEEQQVKNLESSDVVSHVLEIPVIFLVRLVWQMLILSQ